MPGFRDRKIGTFQVSVLRDVDLFVALQFGTPGILTAGEVRDRVIAVNGEPTVRPTVVLTCSFNHKVWNGMDARAFLLEVASILEDGKLEMEAPAALISESAR
jgi:pyruvate/2-oxoglutarate dehydrogenase complex dihydrolipoamide acyltransferase (E2) component